MKHSASHSEPLWPPHAWSTYFQSNSLQSILPNLLSLQRSDPMRLRTPFLTKRQNGLFGFRACPFAIWAFAFPLMLVFVAFIAIVQRKQLEANHQVDCKSLVFELQDAQRSSLDRHCKQTTCASYMLVLISRGLHLLMMAGAGQTQNHFCMSMGTRASCVYTSHLPAPKVRIFTFISFS